jgi:hypothetical protein
VGGVNRERREHAAGEAEGDGFRGGVKAMICEEERQELIAELLAAQVKQKGECFVHLAEWEAWWQKQGGDIVIGLHDLVFGEEDSSPSRKDEKVMGLREALGRR